MIERVLIFSMDLFLCLIAYLIYLGSEGEMFFGLIGLMGFAFLQPMATFGMRRTTKSAGRKFVICNKVYWLMSAICVLAITIVLLFEIKIIAHLFDYLFVLFPISIAVYQQVNLTLQAYWGKKN